MRTVIASAAVLASLLVPASAEAAIVPQKSIGGIALGMSTDEVREAAGNPTRFRFERSEIIGRVRVWDFGLTSVSFNGAEADSTVLSVTTRSRSEKTSSGVGVGSSRAAVRRGVRGARCLVEFSYDHCFVGRFRAGEIVTDFSIGRRGTVNRVTVGRVVD